MAKKHDWEAARTRVMDEEQSLREVSEDLGIPLTTLHRRAKQWRSEADELGRVFAGDDAADTAPPEDADEDFTDDALDEDEDAATLSDVELPDDLEGDADAADGLVDFEDEHGPLLGVWVDEDDVGEW